MNRITIENGGQTTKERDGEEEKQEPMHISKRSKQWSRVTQTLLRERQKTSIFLKKKKPERQQEPWPRRFLSARVKTHTQARARQFWQVGDGEGATYCSRCGLMTKILWPLGSQNTPLWVMGNIWRVWGVTCKVDRGGGGGGSDKWVFCCPKSRLIPPENPPTCVYDAVKVADGRRRRRLCDMDHTRKAGGGGGGSREVFRLKGRKMELLQTSLLWVTSE